MTTDSNRSGRSSRGFPSSAARHLTWERSNSRPEALNRSISGDRLNRGYVQSWNFIVESQLPWGIIGSVGYVGTATVRSFADININAAQPGTGTAGRPFFEKFRRTANTLDWNGRLSTNYHSLQTTINRRVADGLTLKGAYTYSAAINMTDDDGWAGVMWNIPSQFSRNRARAGYDQNHIFQMGYVYELPFGKGKKFANSGAASLLLGNWQVNGVTALFPREAVRCPSIRSLAERSWEHSDGRPSRGSAETGGRRPRAALLFP